MCSSKLLVRERERENTIWCRNGNDRLSGSSGRETLLILWPVLSYSLCRKTSAEQGIILEWCECKCHGSPSPHITADGKSQLSNFWGQVGHSRGVANPHNEGMLKSGLDCVSQKMGPTVLAVFGVQLMTLKIKEEARIYKENHTNEAHYARKCQRKTTLTFVPDWYQQGISQTPSWLN